MNKADVHVSDADSADGKTLTSPPIIISPPPAESTESPSKNSLNSKADSLDDLKIKSDKEIQSVETAEVDQNIKSPIKLSDIKSSESGIPQDTIEATTEEKSPVTDDSDKKQQPELDEPVKESESITQVEETETSAEVEKKDTICEYRADIDKTNETTDNSKTVITKEEGIDKIGDKEVNETSADEVKETSENKEKPEIEKAESEEEIPQSSKVIYFLEIKQLF